MPIVLTDHRGHPQPTPRPSPSATGTGLGAAGQSPVRVSVTPPVTRERDRLTGTARRKVVLDAIGMAGNSTYAEGALSNAADYRGPITPYPATTDTDWNKEVAPWIESQMILRQDYDASGNLSFTDLQRQMWSYRDLEGDCFAVETYEEPENRLSRPVVRLIPSLMCDSPGSGTSDLKWVDGVKIGLHHRALAYHFLNEETAGRFATVGYRNGYEVPRGRVIHFARRHPIGGIGGARGVTRFLTAGKRVLDCEMLDTALHGIFNLAAKLNVSLTQAKDTTPPVLKTVSEGIFVQETVTSAATNTMDELAELRVLQEQFQSPAPTIVDLTDSPGQDIAWGSARDTMPDVSAVRAGGLEYMAMAWGLPVQILFCIFSGVFNVTGPGFRISIKRASRWREEELRVMEPFIRRQYARTMAWGMETKAISRPKKSLLDPFLCRTRWAPDLTIDEQRDVNNDQKRLEMGITSEKELAHLWGRDFDDVLAERADAINKICDVLGDRKKYWGENFKDERPPEGRSPSSLK